MKVIDLTHTIQEEMPVSSGDRASGSDAGSQL